MGKMRKVFWKSNRVFFNAHLSLCAFLILILCFLPLFFFFATLSTSYTYSSLRSAWGLASVCASSSWRDSLILIMSISFAGLGIVSLRNPITELIDLLVSKSDIRTMLCLLVFSIVLLVLGQPFFPRFSFSL